MYGQHDIVQGRRSENSNVLQVGGSIHPCLRKGHRAGPFLPPSILESVSRLSHLEIFVETKRPSKHNFTYDHVHLDSAIECIV